MRASHRPPPASRELDYSDYLQLDKLLDTQRPLREPPHHDEMLFIIQHQISELWMKLILHELRAAVDSIRADELNPCFKILARVKLVQIQLFEQWAVLETLTPSEYAQFRHVLRSASGFQSPQYRMIEFLLGNKDAEMLEMFKSDRTVYERVRDILVSPSIYDEFLRHLSRRGYALPKACIDRDWRLPHQRNERVIRVFEQIYAAPDRHWDAYALCEKLVDVEEQFQLWRFRHGLCFHACVSGDGGRSILPITPWAGRSIKRRWTCGRPCSPGTRSSTTPGMTGCFGGSIFANRSRA